MPETTENIEENSPVLKRTAANNYSRRLADGRRESRRRASPEPPKSLSPAELDSLFRVIKSKRDEAAFRVMYCKGLRVSEIGLLDLSDFDDRGGRLTIHRLKGSLSGTFGMHDKELRAMRAWVRERGTAPGPLFLSRNHRPISDRRLRELMEHYCRRAGIARALAHPHILKHTRGTLLLDETGSLDVVADALGHKQIQNTRIYAQTSDRRREEAIARNRTKY